MQRTIKIKLNPTQKKKDEILSTMEVYKETVNQKGLAKTKEAEIERRRKISEYMKDRRIGKDNPMYGKHYNHTKEAKLKISEARKKRIGFKHLEETKRKMGKSISKVLKGRKLTEEHKKNISLNNCRYFLGKKLSKEHRIKLSKLKKEMYKKGKLNLKIGKKDTSIELKIQDYLKQLEIEFYTHQHIKIEHGYQCDILIPSLNLIIECDGDYWHKYPIGNGIDHIRTKELIEKGFKVLRLWEREIKMMDLDSFRKGLETLNLDGCESYKQPPQEQNIILATGGESSLSSQA